MSSDEEAKQNHKYKIVVWNVVVGKDWPIKGESRYRQIAVGAIAAIIGTVVGGLALYVLTKLME